MAIETNQNVAYSFHLDNQDEKSMPPFIEEGRYMLRKTQQLGGGKPKIDMMYVFTGREANIMVRHRENCQDLEDKENSREGGIA